MPAFEDWLRNPVSIINNIYASDPENFDTKVKEYFENKIKDEKNYKSIPLINYAKPGQLAPNCLVRYRCMIQDSFDPIYYPSTHVIKNKTTGEETHITLKYKEILDLPDGYESELATTHSSQDNLEQRLTYYCIPIPGETEWVKNIYSSDTNPCINTMSNICAVNDNKSIKREAENDCPSYDEVQVEISEPMDSSVSKVCDTCNKPMEIESVSGNKKPKTDNDDTKKDKDSINHFNFNFPLKNSGSKTEESQVACLVKTYDKFDNYKLNDLVEFIGILYQDPLLAYMHDEHGDPLAQAEADQLNIQNRINTNVCKCEEISNKNKILSAFPPSLVPRLHCIKSFNLCHNNPLIELPIRDQELNEDTNENKDKMKDEMQTYWKNELIKFVGDISMLDLGSLNLNIDQAITESKTIYLNNLRKEIINLFQEILLGDALAAEYLLMYLISSVFMRRDVTILGKFTLNITNMPTSLKNQKSYSKCLFDALKRFVPMAHLFDMSIENLNNSNLIPNKDYNKDKLLTGMLQLPNQFHLVIDETVLNSGELNQKGLMNFNSIKDIIKWQKVNYDFSYHQHEFQTNMRLLILSERKSILPSDFQLKLNPNVTSFDSEKYETYINELFNQIDSQLLNNIRKYLTIISNLDYKMNESMQKLVEDDIVNIRQSFTLRNGKEDASTNDNNQPKQKMCVDDLHLLLVVARMQSISFGKTELGLTEWNKAKSIEFERLNKRLI